MQHKKGYIMKQGGVYKNNPADYFSEQASLRKWRFRLQTKKLNHFTVKLRKHFVLTSIYFRLYLFSFPDAFPFF